MLLNQQKTEPQHKYSSKLKKHCRMYFSTLTSIITLRTVVQFHKYI